MERNWIEEFIQDRKLGFKEKSIKTYYNELLKFAAWFEENAERKFHPQEITPIDLKQYREHLMQTKKPTTVNKAVASLKNFCKWAVAQGYIESNPGERIGFVPVQRGLPKWLDRKEQYRLIRVAEKDSPRNYALVMVMLHAGLRVQEVSDLRLSDVSISERKGTIEVQYSKFDKGRVIPLNKDLREAMLAYLKVRDSESKWFFVSQRSEKLSTRAIQHVIADLGYKARIQDLTCHRLRHTFCKNLIDAGVPLDQVAILAGHFTSGGMPNLKSTIIYTQPGEADLLAAVEKIAWD